jgi:hypothetical protein
MEIINIEPFILYDVSHNPSGIENLLVSISKTYSNQAQQYHILAQSLYQQRLRKSGPIPIVNPEAIQSTVNREPFTPTTDFVVGQMDNPSPTAPGTGILDGY